MPHTESQNDEDIVLRRRDGRTFAILVSHNLIAEGTDEADALRRLDTERQRFLAAHAAAGTEELLRRGRRRVASWMLASAGTAFVLVAVVLAAAVVFERSLGHAPEIAIRGAIRAMDKAAYLAEQMSPERQRELATGPVRLIVAARPFVGEIAGALSPALPACADGGTGRSQRQ